MAVLLSDVERMASVAFGLMGVPVVDDAVHIYERVASTMTNSGSSSIAAHLDVDDVLPNALVGVTPRSAGRR